MFISTFNVVKCLQEYLFAFDNYKFFCNLIEQQLMSTDIPSLGSLCFLCFKGNKNKNPVCNFTRNEEQYSTNFWT